MKIYYIYKHIRLDKNEPFYIGFGTKNQRFPGLKSQYRRAFQRSCRHTAWFAIVEKTKYIVEIIYESSDYKDARNKETDFINIYKSKLFDGGTLVNIMSSDFYEGLDKKNQLLIIKKRDNQGYRKRQLIEMYNEDGFIDSFNSISLISEVTGYSKRIIKQILEGKRKNYQGDYFKYKNEK